MPDNADANLLTNARILEDDLHSIAEFVFTEGAPKLKNLRIASSILRRWFCDNDLNKYFSQAIQPRTFNVPVLKDGDIFKAAKNDPNIRYYISAGIKLNGVPIKCIYHSDSKDPPDWFDNESEPKFETVKFTKAIQRPTLYFEGRAYSYESLIHFCANKLGAAHLDHSRDEAGEILERAANYLTIGPDADRLGFDEIGKIHLPLEPDATEAIHAIYVGIISSATMFLNMRLEHDALVDFEQTSDGLEIGIKSIADLL